MMMPINRLATGTAILALVPSIFHEAPYGFPGVWGLVHLLIHLMFFIWLSWRLIVAAQYEEAEFGEKEEKVDA